METFKIKCWNCKGEGGMEVPEECCRPAQHCCGGCTETVKCSICDGEGTQEIDFFSEVKGVVHDDELTPEEVFKKLKNLLKEIKEFM